MAELTKHQNLSIRLIHLHVFLLVYNLHISITFIYHQFHSFYFSFLLCLKKMYVMIAKKFDCFGSALSTK